MIPSGPVGSLLPLLATLCSLFYSAATIAVTFVAGFLLEEDAFWHLSHIFYVLDGFFLHHGVVKSPPLSGVSLHLHQMPPGWLTLLTSKFDGGGETGPLILVWNTKLIALMNKQANF